MPSSAVARQPHRWRPHRDETLDLAAIPDLEARSLDRRLEASTGKDHDLVASVHLTPNAAGDAQCVDTDRRVDRGARAHFEVAAPTDLTGKISV